MGTVDTQQRAASAAPGRKLLGESAFLYLASYLAIFFRFLGGFVIAGLLGPVLYGLRTVFGLITRYEVFSHVGTFDGMRKEVSYHRGRNDPARANLVMDNVYTANALYTLAAGVLLIFAAGYMSYAGYPQIYADFSIFLAIHIALDKLRTFYTIRIIADKNSAVIGKSRVLYDFLTAALSIVFVYFMELRGLLIGLLLAEGVTTAYLLSIVRQFPAIRCSLAVFRPLVRVGMPVMLTGLGFLMLKSVDQIIVAAMLSHEMLGYFGFAVVVSSLIYIGLSDVMGAIFFPRMMEKAGAAADNRELRDYLVQPTLLVAYLLPLLVGAAYLAIHLPVVYLLPEYLPAVQVCKILILGSFFYCTAIMPLMLCVAIDRQVSMLMFTLGAVALNSAFSYSMIRAGFGIEGVAVGTAAAHFIFTSITLGHVFMQLGESLAGCWRFLMTVYAPFAYMALLLFLLEKVALISASNVWMDLLGTALEVLVFSLAFALILIPMRGQQAFLQLAAGLPRLGRRVREESL